MDKEIVIKPSFVFKDYFRVGLYMLMRKPFIVVLFSISILINLFILVSLSISDNKIDIYNSLKPFFFLCVVFPGLLIFSIYRATKKSMENPKLKEDIKIEITKQYYLETGETFSMKYLWKELLKIRETKDWFLIFIEKNRVKIIRKADLNDNQYNELKELFNSLNIKKSLK